MALQKGEAKLQELVPIGDGRNGAQDQNDKASVNEAKSGGNVHGNGKVDACSVYTMGNPSIYSNSNLPLRTVVHGIPNYLVLKSFTRIVAFSLLFPNLLYMDIFNIRGNT